MRKILLLATIVGLMLVGCGKKEPYYYNDNSTYDWISFNNIHEDYHVIYSFSYNKGELYFFSDGSYEAESALDALMRK